MGQAKSSNQGNLEFNIPLIVFTAHAGTSWLSLRQRLKPSLPNGLPRSQRKIKPGAGWRRNHAMRKASVTALVCIYGLMLQPTTWRLSHANASGQQFLAHLGPTVFLFDLGVDRLDVNQQGFIADALVRPWPAGLAGVLAPAWLEVATGADAQHLAGQRDGPQGLVPGYPGVLQRAFRAKYAVIFLKCRAPSSRAPVAPEGAPSPSARHSPACRLRP